MHKCEALGDELLTVSELRPPLNELLRSLTESPHMMSGQSVGARQSDKIAFSGSI